MPTAAELRAAFLAVEDNALQPVDLSEWKIEGAFVRVMSAAERDAFEAGCVSQRVKNQTTNLANVRARLAVKCLVDETRTRIFTDSDADALGAKRCDMLDVIFEAARKVNRLSESDVEELAKNS